MVKTGTDILREGRQYEVDAVSGTADALTIDEIANANGRIWAAANSDFISIQSAGFHEDPVDVTSTSFTEVTAGRDAVDLESIPPAATAYGRLLVRGSISSGTETLSCRPDLVDTDGNSFTLGELVVTTQSTTDTTMDSGWVEISSISIDDIYTVNELQAKVTAGTGTFDDSNLALLVGWRL